MTHPETPINARRDSERGLRAALDRILLFLEEHLVWRGSELLRPVVGLFRRALERVAWVAQRYLLWPAQDHFALLGRPGRALAAGSTVLLLALLGVGALALVGSSGGPGAAPSTPVAGLATQPPTELSAAPARTADAGETLHGAAPVFEPSAESRKDASEVEPAKAIESASAPSSGASAATGTISSDPSRSTSPSARAASSAAILDGPPAGPKAIGVAHGFAEAFVVYETGGVKSEVRRAFAATATPQLSRSLLRRPPRLPKGVEVPKAKVLNVVAGPSHGTVYTVSVSLLRVGVTSELRLDMEHLKGDGWRVTNVLG